MSSQLRRPLRDIGETEKAQKYALSAISFSSEINHLIRAATICGENNLFKEGIKIIKSHQDLSKRLQATGCYAELQDLQGNDNEFRISVKKALSINSNDVSALTHFANMKQKDGELNEAKAVIEKVLNNATTKTGINSQAVNILGKIYEAEGNLENAIQCFRKSIEYHKDNPGAYHSLPSISRRK